MRAQYVRLVGLTAVAAGLVGLVGCDSITAGQAAGPKGPPKLVRVMIQDGGPNGSLGFAIDLLEQDPGVKCDENVNLCVAPFTILGNPPDPTCQIPEGETTGTCIDPLLVPETGVPLEGGPANIAIRMVYDKVLADDSVANPDNSLLPGILTLLQGETPVATTTAYDRSGSPDFTSDAILAPFGPALVMKTKDVLVSGTEYTIRLDASGIRDRKGQAAEDPSVQTFKFRTEKFAASADLAFPTAKSPVISATDVVQYGFNGKIDLSKTGDSSAVKLEVVKAPFGTAADFFVYGATEEDEDTKCLVGPDSDFQLNIFPKLPVWPAGDYEFKFTVTETGGKSLPTIDLKFKVDATRNVGGAHAVAKNPPPGCPAK